MHFVAISLDIERATSARQRASAQAAIPMFNEPHEINVAKNQMTVRRLSSTPTCSSLIPEISHFGFIAVM
jgi:hypothetical protein